MAETPLYTRHGDGTYEITGLTEEYVRRLETALAAIARLQPETIPVYNDEFVRWSWIGAVIDGLIRGSLSA